MVIYKFMGTGFIAAVVSVLTFCCSAPCVSAVIPSPEFLSAALRNQLASGSIEAEYTHVKTARPDEVNRYRYVRSVGKQFLETHRHDGAIGYQLFEMDQNRGRYLFLTGEEMRGVIADKLDRYELGYARLVDPALFNLPLGTLADLIGTGIVSPEMQSIGGYQCWRVEISPLPDRPSHRYIVFVDPDIGFCPRRIENYSTNDYTLVSEPADYKDIGKGIWYPMTMRLLAVVEGKPELPGEIKVKSVKIVDEQYVDSLKVDFPPGTKVRDLILDAEYVVP